jgi:hypothetical protein
MDLDLSPVKTAGRPSKPIEGEIVRQLTSMDLAMLELDRGVKPVSIKKLRDAHHSIARLLAQGAPNKDVAAITGYSESRISILKSDPAFQELMSFYKGKVADATDEAIADASAKLAAVRNDIIEELQDRLADEPEKIATETLLDALKVTADRTGFGPASKSMNLNVNVDLADRVAAGRRRVAQLGAVVGPPGLTAPVGDGANAGLVPSLARESSK